jgi:hypothetical protein
MTEIVQGQQPAFMSQLYGIIDQYAAFYKRRFIDIIINYIEVLN